MQNLREGASDQVVREIDQAIKDRTAKKVSIADVAKRAGSYDSYLTAYAILSYSVHTSAYDLEHHFQVNDVTKQTEGFKYGPSDLETVRAICLNGMAMAEVLELVSQEFGEDRKAVCEAHTKVFQTFLVQP